MKCESGGQCRAEQRSKRASDSSPVCTFKNTLSHTHLQQLVDEPRSERIPCSCGLRNLNIEDRHKACVCNKHHIV